MPTMLAALNGGAKYISHVDNAYDIIVRSQLQG